MFSQILKILKAIGYRNQISALYIILISFFVILLELISFTLIIPVLSITLDNDILNSIPIFGFFKKVLPIEFEDYFTLKNILGMMVMVIFIKTILSLYSNYKLSLVMWQIRVDINSKIYKYFTVISLSEIINIGFSTIRRLINSDATLFVTQGFYNYILLCKNFILLIVLFFFLSQIDAEATLAIFIFLGFFVLVYNKLIKNTAASLAIKFRNFSEYKLKNVNDTIMGIREVKLFNNENMMVDLFKRNETELSKVDIKKNIFNLIPRLLLEFFVVLGVAILVIVLDSKGYSLVYLLPKLALFFLVFLRTLPIAVGINSSLIGIKYSKLQIDEVINQLSILKENKDIVIHENLKKFNIQKTKELELKDVSFSYDKKNKIFENLNVKFYENKLVGIQGENGSGKSTLVDLIAGFLKPSTGSISINRQDIHNNIKDWRKLIGYVSQTPFLTSNTIKNNIIFSTKKTIDEKRFENSIIQSGVKDFLKKTPNGIESQIGDLGLKLSGGQKQRITIARVLYKDPKIIILDEPTSAQDNKIEDYFLKIINELKKDKIIIIISHSKNIHDVCDINYKVENKNLVKV